MFSFPTRPIRSVLVYPFLLRLGLILLRLIPYLAQRWWRRVRFSYQASSLQAFLSHDERAMNKTRKGVKVIQNLARIQKFHFLMNSAASLVEILANRKEC